MIPSDITLQSFLLFVLIIIGQLRVSGGSLRETLTLDVT